MSEFNQQIFHFNDHHASGAPTIFSVTIVLVPIVSYCVSYCVRVSEVINNKGV